MNQEDLNDLISKNPSPEGIANNYNSEVSILQRELLLQADNQRLAAENEELKDLAIWMTGCGYEFTQHQYFCEQRDKLLKGGSDES